MDLLRWVYVLPFWDGQLQVKLSISPSHNILPPVRPVPAKLASDMLVCLKDGSAQISLRAATLRQKLQIKLSFSPSHNILTLGWPVPALTFKRQAPGRVANLKVTGMTIRKNPHGASRNRIPDLPPDAEAVIIRPTRRLHAQQILPHIRLKSMEIRQRTKTADIVEYISKQQW